MPIKRTAHTTPTTPARERYEQQLSLRITLGCKVIDALSHGQHEGLSRLYAECNQLDDCLEATWRYRKDYPERVVAAEELRHHTPGETRPGDDKERPCSWCRRETSGAPDGVVLPARIAA